MDGQAYERLVLQVTDPKLRDVLAEHTDLVGVMEPSRCMFRSIEHLNPGPEAFQDFIRETVGGHYATHKFREVAGGISVYYHHGLQHEGDREQFNSGATMLLASWADLPLQAVTAVFGTVLITGFDFDVYQPRPMDHDQVMASFDQMVANERAAEVARGIIADSGPGSV